LTKAARARRTTVFTNMVEEMGVVKIIKAAGRKTLGLTAKDR